MIEIGSFIGLAALTQSDIRIKDARVNQLGIIPTVFAKLGVQFNIIGDDTCPARRTLRNSKIH